MVREGFGGVIIIQLEGSGGLSKEVNYWDNWMIDMASRVINLLCKST